jgi:heme A synthase
MVKFLHGSWAILVILMFLITLGSYMFAYAKNKVFDFKTDFRLANFTLIVFIIQVILGIGAWFSSPYFEGIKQGHMKTYMKSAHDRLLVVEHPTMMLIALLLALYGYRRMKLATSSKKKYMAIIIFYGLAFLLILARIPWKTWL